jgi:hypothetical protein
VAERLERAAEAGLGILVTQKAILNTRRLHGQADARLRACCSRSTSSRA